MAVKFFKVPNESTIFSNSPKPYAITGAAVQALKSVAFNLSLGSQEVETSIGSSDYGTPIMDVLEFPEDSYFDLDGNEIKYGGIINAAVILEVSQSKNIVKTPIQGRNGTIKEYVSDGDYVINGRGFITSKSNIIPLDDLIAFKEAMQVPQQIEVVSQYLNEVFGINQIVIESFNMPQVEGFRNQIPFSFQAMSDTFIDLEKLE